MARSSKLHVYHDLLSTRMCAADARTYYSRLKTVHGVSWEAAKQYRDDYLKEKVESGSHPDSLRKNGFYLSTTTKDQGQTGMPLPTKLLCSIHAPNIKCKMLIPISSTLCKPWCMPVLMCAPAKGYACTVSSQACSTTTVSTRVCYVL